MRGKGDVRATQAWRRLSKQVAHEEPICWLQLPGICTQRSTGGDHIIPVKYRPDLTLVRSNVRGACGPCNRKRGDLTINQLREIYSDTTQYNDVAHTKSVATHKDSNKALDFFEGRMNRDTSRGVAVRTESGGSAESGVAQQVSRGYCDEMRCGSTTLGA